LFLIDIFKFAYPFKICWRTKLHAPTFTGAVRCLNARHFEMVEGEIKMYAVQVTLSGLTFLLDFIQMY